jgi:hypothetical protein
MEARIPAGLSASEGRKFGLLVGGAFLAIAGIFYWRAKMGPVPYVGGLGGLLVVGGLVAPTALGPIYKAWMGLALVLSKVTTPIVVITPMGMIMKLIGRRALEHKPANNSYWIERTGPQPTADQMKRQF